jgi:RND family efflux transporter MFP subunit
MTIRETLTCAATILAAALLVGCSAEDATLAQADHEHGGGEAITIWTDRVELFFEYPPMIAGAPGEPWAVHLTDLSTFQPVIEGELTLELDGPDGRHTFVADAPARAGIYTPAPGLPMSGMYDLVMVLRGPQVEDEIFVGPIQVFASEEDLPHLEEPEAVGIAFLKEQQWPIDFATAEAEQGEVTGGFEVTGEVTHAPDALVEITAPVAGILGFDRNQSAPAEGARVRAGQVLVSLSPVEGEDTYAQLRARADRLAREVARLERLVAAEAVPARRLEESRHDLAVAQAQLEALGAGEQDGYTLTLRSPIDGTVTRREFVLGQRVDAGAHLLTVMDARRLLVRFHVPASRSGALARLTGATFSPEGSDAVIRADRVVAVGSVLDPVRRTVPVTVEVDNREALLKAGMLVTGRLLAGDGETGVVVPSEAIRDEDGLLVAYVQIGGETFERRAVEVGVTDGQWTVVRDGVRRGERVVTRGAYSIKLSSLNTSEISDHGHPH